MIIKKREYPAEIRILEVLLRRGKLNDETRERLLSEIRKREAGYQGEKRLDYFLSLAAHEKVYLLNNLRLKIGEHAFEIDTVVVTNYFILLIDAKNYSGSLYFDQELKECIRTYKDIVDSILDPLSQSYLHNYQMKNFWKQNKLVTLPILSLVIITHSTTTISTNLGLEKELNKKVIHADHLVERLSELFKTNPNRRLSDKQARDTAEHLLRSHKPRENKVLEQFKISLSDSLTGVQCPSCSAFRMEWKSAKWWCPQCQATSKNAHEQAIYEYLLLYKSISTSECQHFLGIRSIYATRKLLKSMDLKQVGATRDKKYQPPTASY